MKRQKEENNSQEWIRTIYNSLTISENYSLRNTIYFHLNDLEYIHLNKQETANLIDKPWHHILI